jgi:MFS transporter, UMF1 family
MSASSTAPAALPGGGPAALDSNHRPLAQGAWALYDFANTIFSYAIVSTAIGLWLTDAARFGQDTGQLVQGIAISVSVALNAIVSPILGALSDRGGRRLPFLLFFTALTIIPTLFIGPSPALVGALLFMVANFGYQAALIYYDATLATVSTPGNRGRLSGVGVSIGYLGTISVGLLLIFLDAEVDQIFLIAGLLFALFAAPIFLFVRERPTGPGRISVADLRGSANQLRRTIAHAREVPGLPRFLLGRFFYSDAVNTLIVVMSVVAVRGMGLTTAEFLALSIMLTVVAVTASFGWGWLTDRIGPKRTLMAVLTSWMIGLFLGTAALSFPDTAHGIGMFILAGAILGSGLGGVQVADRVFMIRLSPRARLGEFFGIYGLVGKASQVIGAMAFGIIVFLLFEPLGNGAYQIAILTLLGTMLIGMWLILPVSDRVRGVGDDAGATVPPERLAPMHTPLEPRDPAPGDAPGDVEGSRGDAEDPARS